MTGALFPIYQQVTLPYAVVAVTCAFVDNFVPAVDLSPYGTWIAWSLLAYTLFIHGEYVLALIDEICAYLDINCLTIKYKSKASPMVEKKAAAAALATPSKSKQTTPKKVKAAVTPARRQSPRNSARKMH